MARSKAAVKLLFCLVQHEHVCCTACLQHEQGCSEHQTFKFSHHSVVELSLLVLLALHSGLMSGLRRNGSKQQLCLRVRFSSTAPASPAGIPCTCIMYLWFFFLALLLYARVHESASCKQVMLVQALLSCVHTCMHHGLNGSLAPISAVPRPFAGAVEQTCCIFCHCMVHQCQRCCHAADSSSSSNCMPKLWHKLWEPIDNPQTTAAAAATKPLGTLHSWCLVACTSTAMACACKCCCIMSCTICNTTGVAPKDIATPLPR